MSRVMVEHVPTGIEGLDSILNGGLIERSTVLVSGNPGTGKSILGLQYVYNGVSEFGEKGIYLTFEENAADLRASAESVGADRWQEYVDAGEIVVHDKRSLLGEYDFSTTVDRVLEYLREDEFGRLVVDSFTMFSLFFDTDREKREYLLKFTDILRENGLTTLLINEQGGLFPETEIGLENFLTDGNIYLIQTPTTAGVNRYLWVAKMRKQAIETDIFPMEITDDGIVVHPNAAEFSLMSGDEFDGAF